MQKLKTSKLKGDFVVFSSFNDYMKLSIDNRLLTLSRMHGYPLSAYIVARLQGKLLSCQNIHDILLTFKDIRNIFHYSGEAYKEIELLRVDRYTMTRTDIINYLNQNKTNYGYATMDPNDIDICANLLTTPGTRENLWTLDISEDESSNTILRMSALYKSALPENCSKGYLYNAATMDFVEIPLDAQRKDKDKESAINTLTGYEDTPTAQSAIFNLHHLLVLDHTLGLLMTPEAWSWMIPEASGKVALSPNEKISYFARTAAFFHSLIIAPYYISGEFIRASHSQIFTWLDKAPALPQHIVTNYANFVTKYDILGIASIVDGIYNANTRQTTNMLDAPITTIFAEMVRLYKLDGVIKDVIQDKDVVIPILTDLNILKINPRTRTVMMSLPVLQVNLLSDVSSLMIANKLFESMMINAIAACQPLVSRYYTDELLNTLKSEHLSSPFHYNIPVPSSFQYDTTSDPEISGNVVHSNPNAMPATSHVEEYYRENFALKVFAASSFHAEKKKWATHPRYDRDIAEMIMSDFPQSWQSLTPTTIGFGNRVFPRGALLNADFIKDFLEELTGMHHRVLEMMIVTEEQESILATMLSGFAFLIKADMHINKDTPVVTPVEGRGKPYGVSYTELFRLQKYTKQDFISAPTVLTNYKLYVLNCYPIPTSKLAIMRLGYQIPYYYFVGNSTASTTIPIDKFVLTDAPIQFALRPASPSLNVSNVLVTPTSMYYNDVLLLEESIAWTLQGANSSVPCYQTLEGVELPWNALKFMAHIRFISFKNYLKDASANAIVESAIENAANDAVKAAVETMEAAEKTELTNQKLSLESINKKIVTDIQPPAKAAKDDRTSKGRNKNNKPNDTKPSESLEDVKNKDKAKDDSQIGLNKGILDEKDVDDLNKAK